MATINLKLDKRGKRMDRLGRYNLCVIVQHKGEVLYVTVDKLTESQYNHIFKKRSMDIHSKEYRKTCDEFIEKGIRVFEKLQPFDRDKFRKEFFKAEEEQEIQTPTLSKYSDLFEYFVNNKRMKTTTKSRIRTSRNRLEKFRPGLRYDEITLEFLEDFEFEYSKKGVSPATIAGYMRDIRTVLNYHINVSKFIPSSYHYPFGSGGYSIKTFFPSKLVLKDYEIRAIAELEEFETLKQEWARDVWLFLYRCNGINFVDLLTMRWDNIQADCFRFYRNKTKTTRRSNIRPIIAPITPKLREVIDKIGDKGSPFILGKMKDGFSENTLANKSHKLSAEINHELKYVSEKLNLSLNLVLSMARDSFATTLNRNGHTINHIAEHMGHSTTKVTHHYIGQLTVEQSMEINKCLY